MAEDLIARVCNPNIDDGGRLVAEVKLDMLGIEPGMSQDEMSRILETGSGERWHASSGEERWEPSEDTDGTEY